jgi:hypothetical protein
MKHEKKFKIYFMIKIATIFFRFVLILLLGKMTTSETFRDFNIFNAISGFLVLLIGLDVTRRYQALSSKLVETSEILFFSLIHHSIYFVIFLPIILILFKYFALAGAILVIILYFELLTQELSRELVAINKLLESAIVNFLKSALPLPIILIILMIFDLKELDLTVIWASLLFSMVISFIYGSSRYRLDFKKLLSFHVINKSFFILNSRSGLTYLPNTIMSRGLYSIDKILIERLFSLELFNAYVLIAATGAGIVQIIDILFTNRIASIAFKLKNSRFDIQNLLYFKSIFNRSFYVIPFVIIIFPFFLVLFRFIFPQYQSLVWLDVMFCFTYYMMIGYSSFFNQILICFELRKALYLSLLGGLILFVAIFCVFLIGNVNLTFGIYVGLQFLIISFVVLTRGFAVVSIVNKFNG